MCDTRARLAILCQTVVGARQPALHTVALRSLTLREPDSTSLGAIPTAMGGMTRLAYERARQAGVAVEPLLAKAGLTEGQVLDRSVRIKVRDQIEFLELVAQAVADPFLGFHLAQTCDLRELGLLYYVGTSSKTLGDAWRRGSRYTSVVNEGLCLRYMEGQAVTLAFEYVGVPRHIDRQQIEFSMTALVRFCRQLTGRELAPRRVSFTHRRNEDASELSTFYACDVDFGAPADQVTFDPAFRDLPIVTADPHLNELLIGYGDEVLARRAMNRGSFRSQVENAMVPLLPHGTARAGEIAKDLGVSQRTLARRLAAEGVTFSEVLEGLRSDLARKYLADEGLTISQVAWLLGYQEISAFTHAFKRWTGMTPREARASREGGAG
jgi:AraC-like DNA-binding protein